MWNTQLMGPEHSAIFKSGGHHKSNSMFQSYVISETCCESTVMFPLSVNPPVVQMMVVAMDEYIVLHCISVVSFYSSMVVHLLYTVDSCSTCLTSDIHSHTHHSHTAALFNRWTRWKRRLHGHEGHERRQKGTGGCWKIRICKSENRLTDGQHVG